MKHVLTNHTSAQGYFFAALAGLLLAMAFPQFNVAGFGWIAPGLLLFAVRGQKSLPAFRLGCVAGLTFTLTTIHWLLFIPFKWHSIPVGPIAGWLSLSSYLALYPATWVWLCLKIQRPNSPNETVSSSWTGRTFWALACAAIWVALEMLQAWFLTGFPWNFLGVSQHKMLPLIQIASVTGVHGISFLMVWFSVSLFSAFMLLLQKPEARRVWFGEIILPFLVVGAIWFWGFNRIGEKAPLRGHLKIALIQPSIPQEMVWNPDEIPRRFAQLMEISEAALREKPDLLVWPEAALPNLSVENVSAITNLIAQHQVWMIFGSDDYEIRQGTTVPEIYDAFNAGFLFGSTGEFSSRYRKQKLVLFGEYIPFSKQLPFLAKLIPIGNFAAGTKTVPFQIGEMARTSILICFEDIFPQLAREAVQDDTDFLLNLTNDGWFGDSSQQWQHAANALFRAIENGVPLVRCTNNGLTCWIDDRGRLFVEAGNVYAAGFRLVEIPLLSADVKRPETFYHRHGDWFGWSCVALAVLLTTSAFTRRGRR